MNRVLPFLALLSAVVVGSLFAAPRPAEAPSGIIVDYPSPGSLFPPDIIAPLFQWRDSSAGATVWRVQVHFGEQGPHIDVWSAGEKMQIGELDESLTGYVPPTLTPEQAEAHT